jgi:hypothetical protein
MGFEVHSAVVSLDAVAGTTALGTRDDAVSGEVGRASLAWREQSMTWGDARLLTSVWVATE